MALCPPDALDLNATPYYNHHSMIKEAQPKIMTRLDIQKKEIQEAR
jgi:hypothetical protein